MTRPRPSARRSVVRTALLAPLLVGCSENEFVPPPPPLVQVTKPIVRDVVEYAEFTGTTEPFETVEVRARVQGVLEQISFQEGDVLERGQPMFVVEPAPFQAARDASAAEVEAARARANLAEITATKLERAYERDAVSEIQALEARAEHNVAVQNVEVAEKNLAVRELDLSYTQVTAPISGRAEKTEFFVGSLVGGFASSALTRVVDDSKIRVWFTVADRQLLELRDEMAAKGETDRMPEIELGRENDDGFPLRGKVDYADPEVDELTGTLRVRAIVDNSDEKLMGGLFVRLRIAMRTTPDSIIVPEAAFGASQGGRYVLVVGADGVVQERAENRDGDAKLVLGPRVDDGRVVRSGIKPGEDVIVAGLLNARPGANVRTQDAAAAASAAKQPN